MSLKQKNQILELIAPAGNLEKMKTAFAFGADAVYAGIPDFSLRVRINDFTISKLAQAIKYTHGKNKKIYITINIFAHNRHIKKLPLFIKKISSLGGSALGGKKLNPDGLIISDPGVLQIVKQIWPKVNIHLSTQANCTNSQSAKFWHEQGVKRVILGREVTLEEIKEIHKKVPKLELEYFVHGAMCMAYSGRCFLSKYFTDRSANLGDCIQPCRWKYEVRSKKLEVRSKKENNELLIQANVKHDVDTRHGAYLKLVEEKHGSYILNSKDLCLIRRLDELEKAGVKHFKIEGRAKSVYYIANVIGIYSHVIHNTKHVTKKELDFLHKELEEKLYHRGYTEGFLFGDGGIAQNLDNSHKKCNWEFCGQVIRSKKAEVRSKKFLIFIKVHNSLRVGDNIEIIKPFYDIIKMKVESMKDSETGEELTQAHGGQGRAVIIESDVEVPEFSVVRRTL